MRLNCGYALWRESDIEGKTIEGADLSTGGDHLRGVLKAGLGDFSAAQHAGNLVGSGAVVEQADMHFGAAVVLPFLDDEVLIGECRDLRQMRNA
jgi:hypothetical protein